MTDDSIKLILDSIKDLKKDVDDKFRNMTDILNKNIDATNYQALKNERNATKIETIERNITELWARIHKTEDYLAKLDKNIETHLSSESTEKEEKTKKFNWTSLVAPIVVTVIIAIFTLIVQEFKK